MVLRRRGKMILEFHSDPGHGWIKAPRYLVDAVGSRVSVYSYVNGPDIYLEEDCDGPAFLRELDARGATYQLKHINHKYDAPIRCYARARERKGNG
jgi:hypothetical protein